MLNKEEIREVAEDLVEELREMDDGTEICTIDLMRDSEWNIDLRDIDELLEIHLAIISLARKKNIQLGSPSKEVEIIGLPFYCTYVVHNKRAQKKCPYCGSTHTAIIQYGMPHITERLEKKIEEGKVYLGGCCITEFEVDGKPCNLDPAWYCNDCRKEFGTQPYFFSRKGKPPYFIEDYRDIVKSITFEIREYRGGEKKIKIRKRKTDALVQFTDIFSFPIVEDKTITEKQWQHIVDCLYEDLYLHEWKKRYELTPADGYLVDDGEMWKLEIQLEGQRVRTYRGDNAYPPYWKELQKLFRPLFPSNKNSR